MNCKRNRSNLSIYLDENLWFSHAFSTFPTVIAYEYKRLSNLLENGHLYGAFFQIKDMYEVLIKFPTLLIANEILKKETKSPEEINILAELVKKPLSLGDWNRIAGMIYKEIENEHPLSLPLKEIVDLFNVEQITNWRNECIGHGALQSHESEEFKESMLNHLKLIKSYLENQREIYSSLGLYITDGNNTHLLKGAKVDFPDLPGGKLYVDYHHYKKRIPTSPCITFREKKIFFFDTYYSKKGKTSLLDYTSADLRKERIGEIDKLYKMVSAQIQLESFESDFEDEAFLLSEEENLLISHDEVTVPVYLVKRLETLLKKNKKGIFLLQMEGGMGKTTFVKLLDECLPKGVTLPNTNVRAYYINDAYNASIHSFINKTIYTLQQLPHRRDVIIPRNISLNILNSADFANMLDVFRREYLRRGNGKKEKLLFIIDGIDEINETEESTIFDLLPREEELKENVYILLTCRNTEDVSYFVKNKLKLDDRHKYSIFTEIINIKSNERENLLLLSNYIAQYLRETKQFFNISTLQNILSECGNKFIYTRLGMDLLKVNNNIPSYLSDKKHLFDLYLGEIRNIYGEKFYGEIINILITLAISFKKLTILELIHLCNGNANNNLMRFLAYINSVHLLVDIEKGPRGKKYSINHLYIKKYLKEKYIDIIRKNILKWIDEYQKTPFDYSELKDRYIGVYLVKYIDEYLDGDIKKYLEPSFIRKFLELAKEVEKGIPKNTENVTETMEATEAIRILEENAIRVFESFRTVDDTEIISQMIKIYSRVGNMDKVIEIFEQVPHLEKDDSLVSLIITAYLNRGKHEVSKRNFDQALAFYKKSINYSKNNGSAIDRYVEAIIRIGRIYSKREEYLLAKECYSEAISYISQIKYKDNLLFLLKLYGRRALISFNTKEFKNAISDIEKGNLILKELLPEVNDREKEIWSSLNYKLANYQLQGIIIEQNPDKDVLYNANKYINQALELVLTKNNVEDNYYNILYVKGLILALQGNYDEALENLEQSIVNIGDDGLISPDRFFKRTFVTLWLSQKLDRKDVFFRVLGQLKINLKNDSRKDLPNKYREFLSKIGIK